MANPNKNRGDRAERAVRDAFRALGFPHAERTRAGHPDDHGDMFLCPSIIVQCKDVATARYSTWLVETEEQRQAAKADHAILVHKRRGVAPAESWYVVMTVEQVAGLLREAGYGNPIEMEESA